MKRPACVVGCCLLFFLGLLFFLKMPEPFSDDSISGRSISLHGTIDDKYQKKSNTFLMIKNVSPVSEKDPEKNLKIIVKLKESRESLSELPPIGSEVTVKGTGMLFQRARNPGNFDIARYYMIRGIDLEIYDAEIISFRAKGGISGLDEVLCLIREGLSGAVERIYDEEDAGVVKAMLLGDRADLSEDIRNSFRRSGMSHILCISALHITLLGMAFLKLIRKTGLNKPASYILSFVLIFLYGRLTGSGVSTMRALITFALMMAADLAGRTPDLLTSMSIAGVIIILFNPYYLMDAGFILSFSAVSGIGLLGPPVKKLLPSGGVAAGSLSTAFAVTLFMLPVTLYFFYQIPVFSIVINLAVIPLLGILLVSAMLSAAAGYVSIIAGVIFALPSKLILRLYGVITMINDRLPCSIITTGRPEIWRMLLFYLIIITTAIVIEKTDKRYKPAYVISGIAVVTAVGILTFHFRPDIAVSMIDVGQGDCHFIETEGKALMIDCGSSDTDRVAKYRVIPYVLSRGYDTVDYAVLTHPDDDHINGYIEMLNMNKEDSLNIKCFIIPDISVRNESCDELVNLAKDRNIRVFKIKAGDAFSLGNTCFECLNPEKGAVFSDMNEASVCFSIKLDKTGFRALYTGDIEGAAEDRMIERLPYGKYTLLKCAHHGSENSTPESLLDRIKPAFTFISAGVNNRYGHPHEALLGRLRDSGTRIHTTKEEGAVRMDVNGKKVRITHFIETKEVTDR